MCRKWLYRKSWVRGVMGKCCYWGSGETGTLNSEVKCFLQQVGPKFPALLCLPAERCRPGREQGAQALLGFFWIACHP